MSTQPSDLSLPPAVETAIQATADEVTDIVLSTCDARRTDMNAASRLVNRSLRELVALAVAHTQQAEREARAALLSGLASWIRQPGNIDHDDAIDQCARLLENNAWVLQNSWALPPAPDGAQEG